MISISGAYGREYDNIVDIQDDWKADKDFYIVDGIRGSYINRSDWLKYAKEHTVSWSHLIIETNKEQ